MGTRQVRRVKWQVQGRARVRGSVQRVGWLGLAMVLGWFPSPGLGQDWLLDPTSYVASVRHDPEQKLLHLENGLVRRTFWLGSSWTTVAMENLVTHEQWLRGVGPEARLRLGDREVTVGGLTGQPVKNYLKEEWFATMPALEGPYGLAEEDGWKVREISPRFGWKKRPEWMASDAAWPPAGKHLEVRMQAKSSEYPDVVLHYEIYDGLPLMAKWVEVCNSTSRSIRIDGLVSEEIHLTEVESTVEGVPNSERYPIWVESDYAFAAMDPWNAQQVVHWEVDREYETQVNYERRTPCCLRCYPKHGPALTLEAGKSWSSYRVWELFFDSMERERRGLAQRRMYRTLAPWTQENPLMFHKIQSDSVAIRDAIEQAAVTGFEMVIMSFGSGIDLENEDPAYRERFRGLVEEAHTRGVALGGYSLTGSRSAPNKRDNTQGSPAKFGSMPCLGAEWGRAYMGKVKGFLEEVGLDVLENDGPYPGDLCDSHEHPGHEGEEDSQRVQWEAQAGLYRWCRERGIFVNQPDWYFLMGGNKTGMGYRETNWSLPRAEQQIIERQNIYDGTWTKTSSMGWMFVPLSQYHGGGEAATIEPLDAHRDHYEARLVNLLLSGTQACYRGPRLYDTEATRAMVQGWVSFYKRHRQVLSGDLIHLRRADGRDWDGWLMVDPRGEERGMVVLFNPMAEAMERVLRLPLYYTGCEGAVEATDLRGEVSRWPLNAKCEAEVSVQIPGGGFVAYTLRRVER